MTDWQAPRATEVAMKGLCPRCGAPGLFRGAVSFAPACARCGLDFSSFNVGDGPAAFLIFIVGGIVVFGAILLELNVGPSIWVHILLWLPLTLMLSLGLLRVSKALLVSLEFRNQAREGQIDR